MSKSKDAKKPKKMITIDVKREIIEKHENGARVSDLARYYDRSTSTISTILKQKEAIKKVNVSKGATIIHPSRSNVHYEMEKLLLNWIKEKQLTGGAITEGIIREKALEIFEDLKEKSTEQPSISTERSVLKFQASHGWFEKFKKRTGIFSGETAVTAAKEFGRVISEENYIADQVFNCGETDLFWKMPWSVPVSTDEMKEEIKITLALCANASGDLKVKPLLVYHSDKPLAFKKVDKTKVHIVGRANTDASVTSQIFIDWINEVFGPSVKNYLDEKKLPLKCLLILSNDFSHPLDLENKIDIKFKFIKVLYLPSFLLADQIISNFKELYINHLLKCSKNHFVNCLKIINKAWKNMSKTTLNSAWKTLWPEAIENIEESDLTNNIVVELDEKFPVELAPEELCEVQIIQDTEDLKGRVSEEENFVGEIKKMLKEWEEVTNFIKNNHPDKLACARAENFYNETCVEHFRKILKESKSDVLF